MTADETGRLTAYTDGGVEIGPTLASSTVGPPKVVGVGVGVGVGVEGAVFGAPITPAAKFAPSVSVQIAPISFALGP